MTTRRFVFGFLAAVAFLLLFTTESVAQFSSQPPLSPWLSLNNYNRGGVLPNYLEFVRPQQQAIQQFQSQQRQIQSQGAQQQQMQGDMDKILQQPRKTVNFGAQRPSAYNEYLHYYQGIPRRPVPYFSGTGGARR